MSGTRFVPLRPLPETLSAAERTFVDELRRWYRRTGMSLKDLERATHCSDSNWSRYLGGQTQPPEAPLRGLATAARATRAEWLHLQDLRREAEAAREAGRRDAPPAGAAGTTGSAGPPRTYDTRMLDATCRFRGRHLARVENVLTLRALVDGAATYRQMYYCSRDGGVPGRLEMHEGGVVATDEPLGRPNFRAATIDLPRPLAVGESHRLRFDVHYPGRTESEPWFVLYVVVPIELIAVRVAFEPDCVPKHVWRVERVPAEAHGGNRADAVALRLDRFGYVDVEFTDPAPPYNYGIAWEW
jgi:transcriptional regulator with XRE-family HTH domain